MVWREYSSSDGRIKGERGEEGAMGVITRVQSRANGDIVIG